VPNQRAENMRLLPFKLKESLIELMDKSIPESGCGDRSQFIRDAIREKLEALGIAVPQDVAQPASRLGKGGPKTRTHYGEHVPRNLLLNEPANSTAAAVARAGAKRAVAAERRRGSK
jgi:hypothetical protein